MTEIGIQSCIDGIRDPDLDFLVKWNLLWLLYQTVTFLPMIFITLYRFRYQLANEEYYSIKIPLPTSILDFIIKIYISSYLVFYIPELVIILPEYSKICKLISIAHHVITLWGAYNSLKIRHFPWFCLFPLAMHALPLMYPNAMVFNYVYIVSIFITYFGCSQKPYKGRAEFDNSIRYIYLLVVPLIGFWLVGCDNVIMLKK